jgi:hypothetical protein
MRKALPFAVFVFSGGLLFGQAGPARPVESEPVIKKPPVTRQTETVRPTLKKQLLTSGETAEPQATGEENDVLKQKDVPLKNQLRYAVFYHQPPRYDRVDNLQALEEAEQEFFNKMGRKGWLLVSAPNPAYPYYVFRRP